METVNFNQETLISVLTVQTSKKLKITFTFYGKQPIV